jgi:hypothetical protein
MGPSISGQPTEHRDPVGFAGQWAVGGVQGGEPVMEELHSSPHLFRRHAPRILEHMFEVQRIGAAQGGCGHDFSGPQPANNSVE